MGAGALAAVLVGGVLTVVVLADDDRGNGAGGPGREDRTCPEVPAAVAEDATEQWNVEDPDGAAADVTLGDLQPLCDGVLVSWEVWDPDDDEREYPDHYDHVAYGVDGEELWRIEAEYGATALVLNDLVLLEDRDEEVLRAVDADTGEEVWEIDSSEWSVTIDYQEYDGRLVFDEATGLATGGGILDLATGEVTAYDGSLAGRTRTGFFTTQETTLSYVDLDGTTLWSVDLADHLAYRGSYDTLRVGATESVVGVTVDDYTVEDRGDDDDRLLGLDLATGEKRWVVDDITSVAAGQGDTIAAVHRRDGAREDYGVVGDEPPGTVVLLDDAGDELASADLDRVTNWLWRGPVSDTEYYVGDLSTGALLSPGLRLLAEDRRVAGATADGFYTADEADRLTLGSWSSGAELSTLDVAGIGPDPDDYGSDYFALDEVVVLDGAVVAYGDAAVRLYR